MADASNGLRMAPTSLSDKLALLRGVHPSAAVQMNQVDIARGVTPGNVDPALAGLSANDLAQYDRLAWGQSMKQRYGRIPAAASGLLVGGGYEALKAAGQYMPANSAIARGAGALLRAAGQTVGGDAPSYMKTDKTTSDASLGNVRALLYGAWH